MSVLLAYGSIPLRSAPTTLNSCHKAAAIMSKLVKCSLCNTMLNPKNVLRHLRTQHIDCTDQSRAITNELKMLELVKCKHCKSMLRRKNVRRHLLKQHPDRIGRKAPDINDLKQEICPICSGDGGVRNGCYKCNGSGWVSSATIDAYRGQSFPPAHQDDSRVSNANYHARNAGAHYRERDGRIGSNPEHDDYSEEGSA